MEQAIELLHKYYGYETFKPIQARAIQSILNQQDTFVVMPTGGGKSLCYQIPALIFSGLTIVISPLISLMKDQVDGLETLGISAAFINSTLSSSEYYAVRQRLVQNQVRILYVAPERLAAPDFMQLMEQVIVDFIAIDEAHCVSQWGHDFRPSYRQIGTFVEQFSVRPVVAAFTATATAAVRQDIIAQLDLHMPNVYRASFNRPNLELVVSQDANREETLLDFIRQRQSEAGIVYCATRKEVDRLWTWLNELGLTALKYHGGLNDQERSRNQEDFIYDRGNIMIATNAFGMGINKSNVRYVVHYNIPKNIESYYQEIGRAGRDGLPSTCLLLFSPGDIYTNKFLIEQSTEDEQRRQNEFQKLNVMVNYARCATCLRQYILNYFGEERDGECGNCSNCNFQGVIQDETERARLVFRFILELRRSVGIVSLVDGLKGAQTQKVRQLQLENNSFYGSLRQMKKDEIKNLLYTMVAHGYLAISEGEYPTVQMTAKGESALDGQEQVLLRSAKPLVQVQEDHGALLDLLRKLRLELAMAEHLPSYMIFSDATLKDMCARQPLTLEAMLKVSGVGEHKCHKYGQQFLDQILKYRTAQGLENIVPETEAISPRPKSANRKKAGDSARVTLELLRQGMYVSEAASQRELALTTILGHIQILSGEYDFPIAWGELYHTDLAEEMDRIIAQTGYTSLRLIREQLKDPSTNYDLMKVVQLARQLQEQGVIRQEAQ